MAGASIFSNVDLCIGKFMLLLMCGRLVDFEF